MFLMSNLKTNYFETLESLQREIKSINLGMK